MLIILKLNRIMLVSILLLIFTIGAVSASDENITGTTDEVLGSEPTEELEVTQEGDFAELSSLIENTSSGETLYLEKDYVNSKSSIGINITEKITVDGQGHTIDANQKSNIFNINNNKVTLKNINFINSKTEKYSAVYGDCTIINCSFVNCIALNKQYPSIYYDNNHYYHYDYTGLSGGEGGAIYKGTAYDCSFINCSASNSCYYEEDIDGYICSLGGYGGAIFDGNAFNCSFINCHATHYQTSDIRVVNSGCGGAMYNGNAYNCYFEDCHANGGGLYGGDAINSTFIKCQAYMFGGGIMSGNAHNCYFVNCTAYNGDALYDGKAYDCIIMSESIRKGTIYEATQTNCIFINAPLTLFSSNLTVNYGEGEKLPIRAFDRKNNTIDGLAINVKIYKDNKLINSFPSKTGSDLIIDAAPGSYVIALSYIYAAPLNVSVAVNKGSPKLLLANNFAKSGETAKVKVTMSKKATGFARITINGETYRVQINSGVASVEVPNLSDGAYAVKATYNGNAYHTAETMTGTFHVGKFNQEMNLTTQNIKVGETERLTATLAKDATGFVRFLIGEDTYKVAIENGATYVDIKDLKAGTYSVTLKYNGNYKYNAETVSKSFTVSKSSPGITITAQNINVGDKAIIKVNLANDAPGNVQITVNGETHKVKITNGVATLTVSNLKAGSYDVSVKYAGNYKYTAETKTASFNVSKVTPTISVSGKAENGKTVITANINSDAPGNLKITYEGTTYTAKITNGVASVTVDGVISGSHKVKVKYGGNYKYEAATRTRTITI